MSKQKNFSHQMKSILSLSSDRSNTERPKKSVKFCIKMPTPRVASVSVHQDEESCCAQKIPGSSHCESPTRVSQDTSFQLTQRSDRPTVVLQYRKFGGGLKWTSDLHKKKASLNDKLEIEEVKCLDKWEQKHKQDLLNFYVFNLTNRIQGKIMREKKGPSINIKNINFVNKVEHYLNLPGMRSLSSDQSKLNSSTQSFQEIQQRQRLKHIVSPKSGNENSPIFEKGYFEKHVYMMREKMLEMFKNGEPIPQEDKILIENEFQRELKKLKTTLAETKQARNEILSESNDKFLQIMRLNEDLTRSKNREKQVFFMQRKLIDRKYGIGKRNSNSELMKYIASKEKSRKEREEMNRIKRELKNEWEKNKGNISVIDEKIALIKSNMFFVRDILRDYYTTLLRQGIDTRGRGLIWIIQKLEKLGVHLETSMLPKFLSEIYPSPTEFLEKLARLDLEISTLKKHSNRNKKRFNKECLSTIRKEGLLTNKKLGESSMLNNLRLDSSRPSSGFSLNHPKLNQGIVRSDPSLCLKDIPKTGNSFLGETVSPLHFRDYESEIMQKIYEEKKIKQQYALKLGKYFMNIPISRRKLILKLIVAALFGESSFELDIIKGVNSSG